MTYDQSKRKSWNKFIGMKYEIYFPDITIYQQALNSFNTIQYQEEDVAAGGRS